MFRHEWKSEHGFTLIEMLIGMGIMILILGAICSVLSSSLKAYQYSSAQANNTNGAHAIMYALTDELRYAKAMSTPEYSSSAGTSSDNAAYTVSILDSGGNLVDQNRRIYLGTGDDAHTIVIEYGGAIQKRIAGGIMQKITFSRDDANLKRVMIHVELNDKSYSASPTSTFSTIVVMQNL